MMSEFESMHSKPEVFYDSVAMMWSVVMACGLMLTTQHKQLLILRTTTTSIIDIKQYKRQRQGIIVVGPLSL